jgi:hypothetical protein
MFLLYPGMIKGGTFLTDKFANLAANFDDSSFNFL